MQSLLLRYFGGRFISATRGIVEFLIFPVLILVAGISRLFRRRVDVGLGPEPLVNNVYHKRALAKYGYTAETFVTSLYFITQDFDYKFVYRNPFVRLFAPMAIFCWALFRFKCLYIYFNGGALYNTVWLWRFEPFLLRLAGVGVVVMPYGSDVQCLDRCPNLLFRHVMAQDYPGQRHRQRIIKRKIDLWSAKASHVIAGCDWVDYLHYWDTLMLAHFSIDTEIWSAAKDGGEDSAHGSVRPLRVLHAPNHRQIKGSGYILRAVEELKAEGVPIDLVLAERLPNEKIRELMRGVDVVADQLIIGWYAMFALEAMSLGKPVLCYLRNDLKQLYINAGLVADDGIPIINCTPSTIKDTLRRLAADRASLHDIGRQGREFVEKHHSLKAIGETFDRINRSLGVIPHGLLIENNDSVKRKNS